jgi:hypothetical protein
MTAVTPPEVVYCYILPLFIGIWLVMSLLLSVLGGWHSLSKIYRSAPRKTGKLYSFSTMVLGSAFMPMSYRGCMFIRLEESGISLEVFPVFRFFHPRLFIPWDEIISCREEYFWFMKCTTLSLKRTEIQFRFLGQVGKAIYIFLGNK